MVTALEADFKRTLQRQASLEQWAAWLETTVSRALRPHENSPNYAHHARQFLLKWSFYRFVLIVVLRHVRFCGIDVFSFSVQWSYVISHCDRLHLSARFILSVCYTMSICFILSSIVLPLIVEVLLFKSWPK